MSAEVLVEFRSVAFGFNPDSTLFRALSLKLVRGGFYVVVGPSGSGKSTLLRLINRLEEPSQGVIYFKERPLDHYHPPELRRSILFIQQTPVVVEGSVRDNLLLPFTFKHNRDLARPSDSALRDYLRHMLLDDVPLDRNALNLSVGQKQRLCLIRGLLLSPDMMLLDEPTSALDEESARIVENKSVELCTERGLSVVIVSHRPLVTTEIEPVILETRQGRVEVAK